MAEFSAEAVAHATELNEQRLRAWEQGKAHLDEMRVQFPDGKWSVEATEKWDRINADIDRLDAERDVYLKADRRERESAAIREADFRDFGEKTMVDAERSERESLSDFIRKSANRELQPGAEFAIRGLANAAQERELMRSGLEPSEARALAWDTGSVASAVPVTTARSLYQYLEARIAMFRAPTRKFPTGTGEQMKLPKLAAHAIATQVSGQGTTLAGTDPSFASMTLDAYKYAELVIVANEVLQDAVVNISDYVLQDIARALGRKIDVDLVVGSGSGAPNGIMTAIVGAGTIATGGSLITPTYEKLVDLVFSVNDEYRSAPSAAWLMCDSTAGTLRKLRDGAGGTIGAVLWEPSLQTGIQNNTPDRLLGYPVYTDPNVASQASNNKIAAFGDLNAYFVRTVGDPVLEFDGSRYFDTDQTGFRGKWRVDGDLIDTTAVNIMKQSV